MEASELEDELVNAAAYDRALAPVARLGVVRFWPPMLPDGESLSMRLEVVEGERNRGSFDAWDRVMRLLAEIDVSDRRLIWARVGAGNGKVRPWRVVGQLCGCSHEHARGRYYLLLECLKKKI